MQKFIEIVRKLRSPGGCPWDQKQTHRSLTPYILEETWEVIDEIERENFDSPLKEELGDLLLQIVLHAQIADERGSFNFQDVVDTVSKKMVNRHPHVFGEKTEELSEKELSAQWQRIKANEKKSDSIKNSFLPSAPSLVNALNISKKAAGMGFDWESAWDVLSKVEEELDEVREEMKSDNVAKIEEEIGDLLFTITNLARFYKINPEIALKKGNDKFMKRFATVEKAIQNASINGEKLTLAQMEEQWQQVKKESELKDRDE